MPRFTPSPEQLACVEAACATRANLLISALAGAAKTTTLELIAEALPARTRGLYLAFNRKNVDDVKEKLPSNFDCKTLNSIGHSAWGRKLGTRLRLDKGKMYGLLTSALDEIEDDTLRNELSGQIGQMLQDIRGLKSSGHVPDRLMQKYPKCERLFDDAEAWGSLDEEPHPVVWEMYLDILAESFEQAMEGTIDFDDQVLMPTVMRAVFDPYTIIMVDEAQDLSPLNHQMLTRIVGKRRLIAVGDQCQAIYGFRGAYEDGMDQMEDRFNMEKLTLSVSFRCSKAVVEHVKWRAPHMQAWDESPEGQVLRLSTWGFDNIPDNSFVICRNNSPLLSLGIALLKAGRYPNIWGNDISAGILKQLKGLGAPNMSRSSALEAIAQLQEKKEKTVRSLSLLRDKMECLRVFVRDSDNLKGAIRRAEKVFNSEGKIHLMTGHKAKGHEARTVFFLDHELVTQDGQDPNLRYVICTRAKQELIYINSKDCYDLETEA